jgi:hypothetical protein
MLLPLGLCCPERQHHSPHPSYDLQSIFFCPWQEHGILIKQKACIHHVHVTHKRYCVCVCISVCERAYIMSVWWSTYLLKFILEEKTKITDDSRLNTLTTTDFVPIDTICTSSVILITVCYGLYSYYIAINGQTCRPKTALYEVHRTTTVICV